ncbi:flagellar biosynthesis protein FlaG [Saccharibacillus sp. O23]|uniref:flagellar protein FlaG n=1 Tax=Saccharibacillus sp. O23 TaxID=2009338 RepID=UPI000B4E03B6|nr:flagellar protein FlaG [Saccharibacillus sp. O23]OWR27599.1 flagellar biosynthesis protein FlaG [Saccharibacillus sp. O23]
MDSTISANSGGGLPLPNLKSAPIQPKAATSSAQSSEPAAAPISIPQINAAQKKAVEEIQAAMEAVQGPQKTVQLSVHEKTHSIMIKVMNKETGDVIREIPSEKILDVVAKMMELTGIHMDKKV